MGSRRRWRPRLSTSPANGRLAAARRAGATANRDLDRSRRQAAAAGGCGHDAIRDGRRAPERAVPAPRTAARRDMDITADHAAVTTDARNGAGGPDVEQRRDEDVARLSAAVFEQQCGHRLAEARADPPVPDGLLFPGRTPHRAVHPGSFGKRLKRSGLTIRGGRNTALIALAAGLPAAVLADLLAIDVTTRDTMGRICQTRLPRLPGRAAGRS